MNNINSKKIDCCGCRSCEQICPKKCISMQKDEEGFLVPVVDENLCIKCGVCLQKCPQLSKCKDEIKVQDVYAAKAKDNEILMKSSSGGLFSVLAKYVFDRNGKVYGCTMDDDLNVYHKSVECIDDLYQLRGSKYVQSDTRNTYSEVRNDLINDKLVLYSGTACQIAGLLTFLGKKYDNLLTVDIICHGVPSYKMFANYLNWLGEKKNIKIQKYEFRNKEKNRWGLTAKVESKEKNIFINGKLDSYYRAFLECKMYRESCYQCKYANKQRVSDITLGDYWGIEKHHPEFVDDRGISVVIINSKVGQKVWRQIESSVEFIVSTYEKAAERNSNLLEPSKRPACRGNIYQELDKLGNKEFFERYLNVGLQPKERMKSIIPYEVKCIIKRCIARKR